MALLKLPDELLDSIVKDLASDYHSHPDLHALTRTSRRLYSIANSRLYIHNAKYKGSSALLWASKRGQERTARLALDYGASVHAKAWGHHTPLLLAAKYGYLAIVKLILGVPTVSVHATDREYGQAVLLWPPRTGSHEIAKPPPSGGNIVNDADNDRCTPLMWAVRGNFVDIVRLLLADKRVDPVVPNSLGMSPLMVAATRNFHVVAGLLLADDRVDPQATTVNQMKTPLALAASCGSAEVVRLLLSDGRVDPNKGHADEWPWPGDAVVDHFTGFLGGFMVKTPLQGPNAWSPLVAAARTGHTAVVKLLLDDSRVDPNNREHDDWWPLLAAARAGHEDVVKLLLNDYRVDLGNDYERVKIWSPLAEAARGGHHGIVKMLLKDGHIDPNNGAANSWPPLVEAASHGREMVVRLLLNDSRVDPNNEGKSLYSPLFWAVRGGHIAVAKLLITSGWVDPLLKNGRGETAICLASVNGDIMMAKLLLCEGRAGINTHDSHGNTPLSCAVAHGRVELVKFLLADTRIDPNIRDRRGRTPLWVAATCPCYTGHSESGSFETILTRATGDDWDWDLTDPCEGRCEEIVEILLMAEGINVNLKNKDGVTPLFSAVRGWRSAVVKLLLARDDVDVNAADHAGQTPLWWARADGNEDMVRLLTGKCPSAANMECLGGNKSVRR